MNHHTTKTTKWYVCPAETQISLGIHPVWSESLLFAWRKLGSLATHWAHSEDPNQTGQMPRLIWIFAGRTFHFVVFVMRQLKCIHLQDLVFNIHTFQSVSKRTISNHGHWWGILQYWLQQQVWIWYIQCQVRPSSLQYRNIDNCIIQALV